MPYAKEDARSNREYRLLAKAAATTPTIEGEGPGASPVDQLVKKLVAP